MSTVIEQLTLAMQKLERGHDASSDLEALVGSTSYPVRVFADAVTLCDRLFPHHDMDVSRTQLEDGTLVWDAILYPKGYIVSTKYSTEDRPYFISPAAALTHAALRLIMAKSPPPLRTANESVRQANEGHPGGSRSANGPASGAGANDHPEGQPEYLPNGSHPYATGR